MAPSVTEIPLARILSHRDIEAPAAVSGQERDAQAQPAAAHIASDRAEVRLSAKRAPAKPAPSRWRRFLKVTGVAAAVVGGGAGTDEAIRAIVASRQPRPQPQAEPAPPPQPAKYVYHPIQYFHDGKIEVAAELNQTYHEAVAYFSQAPRAKKMYEKLRKAEPNPGDVELSVSNSTLNSFEALRNAIFLYDTHKVMYPTGDKTTDVGVVSVAGSLQHEMVHAEHAHDNLAALFVRSALPHPDFDDLEERETILQVNEDNKYLPQEAIRTDHNNAVFTLAENTTDASLSGFPANASQLAHVGDNNRATNTTIRYAESEKLNAQDRDGFLTIVFRYPETFNRSTVEQTLALMDRGHNITTKYATAKNAGADVTALSKDLNAYVEAGRAFAAAITYVPPRVGSSVPATAQDVAPAPAPSGAPVSIPPAAPETLHGAPAAEAAPSKP